MFSGLESDSQSSCVIVTRELLFGRPVCSWVISRRRNLASSPALTMACALHVCALHVCVCVYVYVSLFLVGLHLSAGAVP